MASLYSKNNKLYMSIYHLGKRVTKSTGLSDTKKNRKLVEQSLLPEVLYKIQTGQLKIAPSEGKTFSFYAEIFMDIKKQELKQASIRRYSSVLETHILPMFAKKLISTIKVSEVRNFVNGLKTVVSNKTIDIIMIVLNGVFQEAIYDEEIDKNPLVHIKRSKDKSKPADPFSKEEVKILIENAEGWFKNFLGFAFFTGARTGEILGLKWSDIDLKSNFIHIRRTRGDGGVETIPKTSNSIREIPIFAELKPYVLEQFKLTGSEDGYVFLTKQGQPFTDSHRIRDYHWKRLLKSCDIKYRRLYDTRSTFATLMVSGGKYNVNLIAQVLGHADVSMLFRRYNKFIKSELKQMDLNLQILE